MNKFDTPIDCLCELIQRGEQLNRDQEALRRAIAEAEAELEQAKKKVRRLRRKLAKPKK
jgi:multidrug resistance efflux pump